MRIATAVNHYRDCGYEYIDVPWIVPLDVVLITRPFGARLFSTFAGELVASGEQSFLAMRKKNGITNVLELDPGKYQCVTPCFRDEPLHDELHLQYFMKNELMWVPDVSDRNLCNTLVKEMVDDVLKFISHPEAKVVDVPLDNAYCNKDIVINGIEVGSYGVRALNGFIWVYGTGCAEPRLSQAIRKSHEK